MASSEQYNAVFEGSVSEQLAEYQAENEASKAEALRHYVRKGVQSEQTIATDGGTSTSVRLEQVSSVAGVGAVVAFLLVLSGLGEGELLGAAIMLTIVAIGGIVVDELKKRREVSNVQ